MRFIFRFIVFAIITLLTVTCSNTSPGSKTGSGSSWGGSSSYSSGSGSYSGGGHK